MVTQLRKIEREETEILARTNQCIRTTEINLEFLEEYVKSQSFESMEEEVVFYKNSAPYFYSLYIYYANLHNIESIKPIADVKTIRKYLHKKLNKISAFYKKNLDFYLYYRSGKTNRDKEYFTQNESQYRLIIDIHAPFFNQKFCTQQCYRLSTLLANERLKEYLQNEISALKIKGSVSIAENTFKVNTSLSVAHLACLLRLFYEENILSNQNQTELINFFASHLASVRQEHISGTSLRAKYYNIDKSTSEAVKDLLFQLLNRLKKL